MNQKHNDHPVLITGGTGFIGSYLAMALLENDRHERVVLFDRDPDIRRLKGFGARYEAVKDRITYVQGDLSLLQHVTAVFDVHEPKSVFHLGALLSAGAESNPTMGFQVDLVGTWHVLEAARLYYQCKDCHKDRPLTKVIFPSTIASFGEFIPPGSKVLNEAVQMPTTMYGVSKVSSERLGEYYHRKQWLDFRAVRFPSVIGAARGPGGTTVYSTLMVQEPLRDKPYEAYVTESTRLDVLYVKDAVKALLGLHDADSTKLKRRVYNIAGIRIAHEAPQAKDIAEAVKRYKPSAGAITYKENPDLTKIVQSFGILDDTAAREDWGWRGDYVDGVEALNKTVKDFDVEAHEFSGRIKSLELFGA
jgi:threonine 3-dehydrogenase